MLWQHIMYLCVLFLVQGGKLVQIQPTIARLQYHLQCKEVWSDHQGMI
jgi:hypothetical protein